MISPATPPPIIIYLENQTQLDTTKYTIYVAGFSASSKKELAVDSSGTVGTFQTFDSESGNLKTYKLGTGITEISIPTANFNSNMAVDGARIYFFVAENSVFPNPPVIAYSNYGAQVTNVPNPPQSQYPPYSFSEFTLVDLNYGAVIDLQTVDGFVFSMNLTLAGTSSPEEIGQPLGYSSDTLNRSAIFTAYSGFMRNLGSAGEAYDSLLYTQNSGGLLNPGLYLSVTNPQNELLHLDSPLNTVFDKDLDSLFKLETLSIQGVAKGSIAADVYTSTAISQQTLPSGLTHSALEFTGKKSGQKFYCFNPVNLCVLSFISDSTTQQIRGTVLDSTLTFSPALPSGTPIVPGMYVSGAGLDPNSTQVVKVHTNTSGEIDSVTLNKNYLNPAPNSQYGFSKVAGMFATSGAMVFANSGVFAWADSLDADSATVQLNLQNQLVSALNRGVALKAPTSGSDGYTSAYWGTQNNWYPASSTQNLFSLFMHTGSIPVSVDTGNVNDQQVPIFIRPANPAKAANGAVMGQAYGFAYDENAGPVPPAPPNQPDVPSKYDPIPAQVTNMTITLGAW